MESIFQDLADSLRVALTKEFLTKELLSPEVLVWVVPCVFVCICIGFVIGRSYTLRNLNSKIRRERANAIRALQDLVASTDQLSSEMDTHNYELATVGRSMVKATSDTESSHSSSSTQRVILSHIAEVIEANKRLEDDLVLARYRLDEQSQELDRTRKEARTDDLSGVANRKAFDEALRFRVTNLKRRKAPFALVLTDVDHFKRINDTHGHQAGDRVVSTLGDVFKQQIRNRDFVGRYGGDEFAILLTGLTPSEAESVACRIIEAIQKANFEASTGANIAVTMSMGMAFATIEDMPEDIIERADVALYRAKQNGRNQLYCLSEEVEQPTREERELVSCAAE